jgi:hypothetical protein
MSDYERRSWFEANQPPLTKLASQPKSSTVEMNAEAAARWNAWATKLIDDHGMVLARTIGEEVGLIHRDINRELNEVRAELTALKVELRVLRGEVKGEVALLPNWRKRDAA